MLGIYKMIKIDFIILRKNIFYWIYISSIEFIFLLWIIILFERDKIIRGNKVKIIVIRVVHTVVSVTGHVLLANLGKTPSSWSFPPFFGKMSKKIKKTTNFEKFITKFNKI